MTTIPSVVFITLLIIKVSQEIATNRNCDDVICPKPLCANPMTPPGKCCPTCQGSHCMFKGCVQFEPYNKVRWWPEKCMSCRCFGGRRKACSMPMCANRESVRDKCLSNNPITELGYRPYVCCPRCDYGIPEQACQLVPSRIREVTAENNSRCVHQYIDYKCDKVGYRSSGKKFRCMEKRKFFNVTEPGCDSLIYSTATSCFPMEDPTLINAEGCDLFVV